MLALVALLLPSVFVTPTSSALQTAEAPATYLRNSSVIAVVLFPGFELLDIGAPGEILGGTPGITLIYCAQQAGPVFSSAMEVIGGDRGPALMATHSMAPGGKLVSNASGEVVTPDGILVPGGKGVRTEVGNDSLLQWLGAAASNADIVFTVCAGSWLLAVTGVLDGMRATSNKFALKSGAPQSARPQVTWVLKARWVEFVHTRPDGRKALFLSSSGVSAGGDASLALVASLKGMKEARRIATAAEWSWHEDSTDDPFAVADA